MVTLVDAAGGGGGGVCSNGGGCGTVGGAIDYSKTVFSTEPLDAPASPQDALAHTTQTIWVQAYDSGGNPLTSGGDSMWLWYEEASASMTGPSSAATWLHMDDKSNGRYSLDLAIALDGSYNVGVRGQEPGLQAEYFTDDAFGNLAVTQTDYNIDYNWHSNSPSAISSIDDGNNFSVRWTGQITCSTTQSVQFKVTVDNYFDLWIDGSSIASDQCFPTCPQSFDSTPISMTQDVPLAFQLDFKKYDYDAEIKVEWNCDTTTTSDYQVVPASAFSPISQMSPIGSADVQITIEPNSRPEDCTIEPYTVTQAAGDTNTITIQSRDINRIGHTATDNTFTIELVDTADSMSVFSYTSINFTGAGTYVGQPQLTIAGTYELRVYLQNAYTGGNLVQIGDPSSIQTITVTPGPIDPQKTQVSYPLEKVAGDDTYSFTLEFYDTHNNLKSDLVDLDKLRIVLEFDNRDGFLSSIVEDAEISTDTTFDKDLTCAVDTGGVATVAFNKGPNLAGVYNVQVFVNDEEVPTDKSVTVVPSAIEPSACVAVGFPSTMMADLTYSFLIQARDEFNNNVQQTLASQARCLQPVTASADFQSLDNPNAIVLADIADSDEGPGVFTVSVSVPGDVLLGDYQPRVLLTDATTFVPIGTVKFNACSNFIALELGLVEEVNYVIVQLDSITFTEGDAPKTLKVTAIASYCNYKPTWVIESASLLNSSVSLTEADLAKYGISLQAEHLVVNRGNLAIKENELEVFIRASLVEEPAWFRDYSVTIRYQSLGQSSVTVKSSSVPRFKSMKRTPKDQLLWTEDDSGNQLLSNVTLPSTLEWSKVLPPIEDEESGSKFTIDVDLGAASKFLSYDPQQQLFQHNISNNFDAQTGNYTVQITIMNWFGRLSKFQLNISYILLQSEPVCEDKATDADMSGMSTESKFPRVDQIREPKRDETLEDYISSFSNIYRLAAKESSFWTTENAKIERITPFGEVTIKLSQAIDFPSDALSIFNMGQTTSSTSKSCKVRPQRRLWLQMMEFDSELISENLAKWTVTQVQPTQIKLQLSFVYPYDVSQGQQADKLMVFLDLSPFKTQFKGLDLPSFVFLQEDLPRFVSEDELSIFDQAGIVYESTIYTFVSSYTATNLAMSQSLQSLWSLVNTQQIYLYFPMFEQLRLPENAWKLNKKLLDVLSFDLIDTGDRFDPHIYDSISDLEFTTNFKECGYESLLLVVNISTIVWTYAFHIVFLLLGLLLVLVFCRKGQNRLKDKFTSYFFLSGPIRLYMETFQDLLLSATLNVSQINWVEDWHAMGHAERYSLVFSLVSLLLTVILLPASSVFYYCKFNTVTEAGSKYSELFTGMKSEGATSRWLLLYPGLFFLRRIAFVMVAIFGGDFLIGQLLTMLVVSTIIVGYISNMRPHKTPAENKLELMNEATIILLAHCNSLFTPIVASNMHKRNIGWIYIGICITNLVIHISVMVFKVVYSLKLRLRRYFYRRAVRKIGEQQAVLLVVHAENLKEQTELERLDSNESAAVMSRDKRLPFLKSKLRKQVKNSSSQKKSASQVTKNRRKPALNLPNLDDKPLEIADNDDKTRIEDSKLDQSQRDVTLLEGKQFNSQRDELVHIAEIECMKPPAIAFKDNTNQKQRKQFKHNIGMDDQEDQGYLPSEESKTAANQINGGREQPRLRQGKPNRSRDN